MPSAHHYIAPCPSWCTVRHDPVEPGEHESRPIRVFAGDPEAGEPYVMIMHAAIGADEILVYVGDGFDAHIDVPIDAVEAILAAFTRQVRPSLAA